MMASLQDYNLWKDDFTAYFDQNGYQFGLKYAQFTEDSLIFPASGSVGEKMATFMAAKVPPAVPSRQASTAVLLEFLLSLASEGAFETEPLSYAGMKTMKYSLRYDSYRTLINGKSWEFTPGVDDELLHLEEVYPTLNKIMETYGAPHRFYQLTNYYYLLCTSVVVEGIQAQLASYSLRPFLIGCQPTKEWQTLGDLLIDKMRVTSGFGYDRSPIFPYQPLPHLLPALEQRMETDKVVSDNQGMAEVQNAFDAYFKAYLQEQEIPCYSFSLHIYDQSCNLALFLDSLSLVLGEAIYFDDPSYDTHSHELRFYSQDALYQIDCTKGFDLSLFRAINTVLAKQGSALRVFRCHYQSFFVTTRIFGLQLMQYFESLPPMATSENLSSEIFTIHLEEEEETLQVGYRPLIRQSSWLPIGKAWEDLFSDFLQLDNHKNMPSKKWYQSVEGKIEQIGREAYVAKAVSFVQKCLAKSVEYQQRQGDWGVRSIRDEGMVLATNTMGETIQQTAAPEWVKQVYGDNTSYTARNAIFSRTGYYFYYTLGGRILRGIIHSAILVPDKALLKLVDEFAQKNPNESADAIHVYTQLPAREGVARLARLCSKIKKKNIQTRIATALKKMAEKIKLSPDHLEEMAISDYGLDHNHQMITSFGSFQATYTLKSYKESNLEWVDPKGKIQKSVPAEVKNNFAEEFKSLKASIKELEALLPSQKDRIEGFYLKDRTWTYAEWQTYYLQHPFIGVFAKKLIWHFSKNQQKTEGIWQEGHLRNVKGEVIHWLEPDTSVQLWHPIGFPAEYILLWRTFVLTNQMEQPFKQAFREVYLLTDAELNTRTYSNRFAAHLIRRELFGALCKARGWTPVSWSAGQPTRKVDHWNLKVEFWVQEAYLGEQSERLYGSAHASTDQVRFYRRNEQISLDEVPAMVFSEMMRDVDLFVGVASIGNDPVWQDRGEDRTRHYWNEYAFGDLGESAKGRTQVLQNLVPKLKIASQCSFEGKFLKVRGHIRTYKIHLGSGNILMEPNDHYLCIVPDASKISRDNLFLPFDGDALLSIIVSKALLLAADNKIADPVITRQLAM
jgi:hypothetical protein